MHTQAHNGYRIWEFGSKHWLNNETLHQCYFDKTFLPLGGSIFLECLGFPCHGWDVVNKHMRSCKSLDKPAKKARMLIVGFELKCSFHAQETYQLEP